MEFILIEATCKQIRYMMVWARYKLGIRIYVFDYLLYSCMLSSHDSSAWSMRSIISRQSALRLLKIISEISSAIFCCCCFGEIYKRFHHFYFLIFNLYISHNMTFFIFTFVLNIRSAIEYDGITFAFFTWQIICWLVSVSDQSSNIFEHVDIDVGFWSGAAIFVSTTGRTREAHKLEELFTGIRTSVPLFSFLVLSSLHPTWSLTCWK